MQHRLPLALVLLAFVPLLGACRGDEVKALPRDASAQALDDARGCDRGEMTYCNNLAASYEYGDGVPVDYERAMELYERSCRAGAYLGCTNLASMLWDGRGTEQDLGRALALYEDTCGLGEAFACMRAADLIRAESPADVDPERAWAFYGRACEADLSAACVELGWRALDESEGPVDYHEAAARFGVACDRGLMTGCAGMGFVILDGQAEGRRDVQLAANYLERGCMDDHAASCRRLSSLYETGLDVVEADAELAEFYAERALELDAESP